MLTIFITIVHILVSLFLILVVLAQQGKGQDLASAFGGTGSQTAFGARWHGHACSPRSPPAPPILFMVTSLSDLSEPSTVIRCSGDSRRSRPGDTPGPAQREPSEETAA